MILLRFWYKAEMTAKEFIPKKNDTLVIMEVFFLFSQTDKAQTIVISKGLLNLPAQIDAMLGYVFQTGKLVLLFYSLALK